MQKQWSFTTLKLENCQTTIKVKPTMCLKMRLWHDMKSYDINCYYVTWYICYKNLLYDMVCNEMLHFVYGMKCCDIIWLLIYIYINDPFIIYLLAKKVNKTHYIQNNKLLKPIIHNKSMLPCCMYKYILICIRTM